MTALKKTDQDKTAPVQDEAVRKPVFPPRPVSAPNLDTMLNKAKKKFSKTLAYLAR